MCNNLEKKQIIYDISQNDTPKVIKVNKDDPEEERKWHTLSCVYYKTVLGIWGPNSDGTDILAMDKSEK